jgi:hypothetical protein
MIFLNSLKSSSYIRSIRFIKKTRNCFISNILRFYFKSIKKSLIKVCNNIIFINNNITTYDL